MTGKCSLCGSRLNNGKCEFCGLDSRMYDRKYMQDPYHMAEIAGEADTPTASPRQMQRSPGTSFNSLEVSCSKRVSSVPSRPI